MVIKTLLGNKVIFAISPISLVAFQAAQNMDLGPLGSILTQLGAAAAAVIVTVYFIAYIRDQNKVIDSIRTDSNKSQQEYRNSLEDLTRRFSRRQEELQDFFEKQLKSITTGQTEILKETIQTVKAFEKTLFSVKNEIEVVLVKLKPTIQIEAKPRMNQESLSDIDDKLKKLNVETEFPDEESKGS